MRIILLTVASNKRKTQKAGRHPTQSDSRVGDYPIWRVTLSNCLPDAALLCGAATFPLCLRFISFRQVAPVAQLQR